MNTRVSMIALAAVAALAGCQSQGEAPADGATPTPAASETAQGDESVSILRPEVEQPELVAVLEPLEVTIGFPEGGSTLSDEAVVKLKEVLASPQIETSARIVLRGHTDSAGTDAANLRASEARANAVGDWLVENGIEDQRIVVIPMGEQNPLEPNALEDGEPNVEGRAANRRVEIVIAPAPEDTTKAG